MFIYLLFLSKVMLIHMARSSCILNTTWTHSPSTTCDFSTELHKNLLNVIFKIRVQPSNHWIILYKITFHFQTRYHEVAFLSNEKHFTNTIDEWHLKILSHTKVPNPTLKKVRVGFLHQKSHVVRGEWVQVMFKMQLERAKIVLEFSRVFQ